MSTKDRGHLLVVDDNKAIRKLIAAHFCDLNYRVTEAQSAEEAKELLIKHDFQFDLVLSDIAMPGESGFDLLKWIKSTASRPEDLPVLLMTGVLPDAESRLKGLALGAVDYVVRPDEITELVVRSINAIEQYKRVRSLERSLEDTQDLASVGRMLAAANHEIKNIAAIVKLSADQAVRFLRTDSLGNQDIKQQVAQNLEMSTNLLADVVRSFKAVMDEGEQKMQSLSIEKIISDTLQLLEFRTSSCFIRWQPGTHKNAKVRGQATLVKQVLINLVLNGLESITELAPPEGGQIEVSLKDDDGFWTIEIKDNGIGFASGTKDSFRAFETTRKMKGGQGLGLWLCSMFVESMGGSLTLSSYGPSTGATAQMKLPKPAGSEVEDFAFDIAKYLADNEA